MVCYFLLVIRVIIHSGMVGDNSKNSILIPSLLFYSFKKATDSKIGVGYHIVHFHSPFVESPFVRLGYYIRLVR